jgi:hypothetical protein
VILYAVVATLGDHSVRDIPRSPGVIFFEPTCGSLWPTPSEVPFFHPYSFYPIPFIMPGSRLKKRPSVDPPGSSQSKPMHSPSSPEPKLQSPREPYPMPSSNPASQYTLMEKLGTGSFGTVYKAMHNETKQIVAVKQIGASFAPRASRASLSIHR